MLKPQKGTPQWHQLKIALDDLRNPLKAQFLSNRTREDIIDMLKKDFQCTDAEIAKLAGQKVGFNTEVAIPVNESQLKAILKRLIKEESAKLVGGKLTEGITLTNQSAVDFAKKLYTKIKIDTFSELEPTMIVKVFGELAKMLQDHILYLGKKFNRDSNYTKIGENLNEAPGDPYEVEYYVRVGEHSHIGQFPTFEQALREAVKLKKRFDKERATEEPGSRVAAGAGADGLEYIGVNSNDEFAVIYITQWYIDYSKSLPDEGFNDPESAQKWMAVAMKCLQTGKPVKGNYNTGGK